MITVANEMIIIITQKISLTTYQSMKIQDHLFT